MSTTPRQTVQILNDDQSIDNLSRLRPNSLYQQRHDDDCALRADQDDTTQLSTQFGYCSETGSSATEDDVFTDGEPSSMCSSLSSVYTHNEAHYDSDSTIDGAKDDCYERPADSSLEQDPDLENLSLVEPDSLQGGYVDLPALPTNTSVIVHRFSQGELFQALFEASQEDITTSSLPQDWPALRGQRLDAPELEWRLDYSMYQGLVQTQASLSESSPEQGSKTFLPTFSCPFVKHDVQRYAQVQGECTHPIGMEWGTLLTHIHGVHSAIRQCIFCGYIWPREDEWEALLVEHVQSGSCVSPEDRLLRPECMTADQELSIRGELDKDLSEDEMWVTIYLRLFSEWPLPNPHQEAPVGG